MIFAVHHDSEVLRRELRVSQAVARVRLLPTNFLANPLLAASVVAMYWSHAHRMVLVLFLAATVVLWTPAVLSWRRLRHRARPTRVSVGNERRAMLFSGMAGALWAFAAAALFPAAGPAEQATLVLLLGGLCAGSVAFFSSSPAASMAFYLPFMLTLFVQALTFAPVGGSGVLPAAIGLFTAFALLFTRTSWHNFVETVRVLVDRDRLLNEAKESSVQLELTLTRMQDLAMVDELTGLKNRRSFFDAIDSVIAASRRRGKPVSVAMLDVDHFKDVNDTYGHSVGDVVLREISKRIEDTLRQEQIVGRVGGDEFVVLLPDTTPQQALVAIERVRKAIDDRTVEVTGAMPVHVSVCGGISSLADGMPVTLAIQQADKAMYRAKALGRNRVEVFGEVEDTVAVH